MKLILNISMNEKWVGRGGGRYEKIGRWNLSVPMTTSSVKWALITVRWAGALSLSRVLYNRRKMEIIEPAFAFKARNKNHYRNKIRGKGESNRDGQLRDTAGGGTGWRWGGITHPLCMICIIILFIIFISSYI